MDEVMKKTVILLFIPLVSGCSYLRQDSDRESKRAAEEIASLKTLVAELRVQIENLQADQPEDLSQRQPWVVQKPGAAKKTGWRALYEARFGSQSDTVTELAMKRGAMIALVSESEESEYYDKNVLHAMRVIPMELFCAADQLDNLYGDLPVPIGFDETISQPVLTVLMLTVLKVNRGDKVLELKTASGYQTALLAQMGAEVYSLESDRALGRVLAPTLNGLGFDNLHYVVGGDGYAGLPQHGPYDRIIATAAYPEIPQAILKQLKPGGRFIAPVGAAADAQFLMLYTKTPAGELEQVKLLPVAFSAMPR